MSSASVTAPATTEIADLQSHDEASRTLLDFLTTEKMDGSDRSAVATATATPIGSDSSSQGQLGRWGTLKQRLGLNAIICCGGGWAHHNRSFSDALLPAVHEDYDDPEADEDHTRPSTPDDHNEEPTTNSLGTPGVNLATALAAERQSRQLATTTIPPAEVEAEGEIFSSVPGTPTSAKVSLMRLMAEAAVEDEEAVGGDLASRGAGSCCVCMERKKGAAFIPCGHTFCRVCSRELWLNRGSCPLCNRSILDVLDIF